jgi:hypothetical protein
MYPDPIEIDGERADDDQHWRIERIHRILGYAQALADADGNDGFYKKITSFYDFKGTLTVTWNVTPSAREEEYIGEAWMSIITDYESNPIDHVVES